ncbi:ABC transporter permease [Methylococcus mesophilus]|uniref:ABC transporter permease n=1 Tax=Methylococcus mesophilus TaxID=2993564 RepID=UPI00224AB8B8|nr:ABC transporter permease [Methylococcus mesophilus]UZR29343.1 ABC transporter permease [Methylococcus mesophilus]
MLEAAKRWKSVWRRNAWVWRKGARTALLGGFVEPLFNLLVLGFGLGSYVGRVSGLPYLDFLAGGILATSAMNAATFEGLYLAYTRMAVLKTWDGMLAAPLSLADVVCGEVLWMGTKSVIGAGLILAVLAGFGLATGWAALGLLPLAFLAGVCFGSIALVVTSFARSYDFFVYYITLGITPMILLSGVFFPSGSLPPAVRAGAECLPLFHVVEAIRPLLAGNLELGVLRHAAALLAFAVPAIFLAIWRLERRLTQ